MDSPSLVYTLYRWLFHEKGGVRACLQGCHRILCEGLSKGKWTSEVNNFGFWRCTKHRTTFWKHKSTCGICNGSFPVEHSLFILLEGNRFILLAMCCIPWWKGLWMHEWLSLTLVISWLPYDKLEFGSCDLVGTLCLSLITFCFFPGSTFNWMHSVFINS